MPRLTCASGRSALARCASRYSSRARSTAGPRARGQRRERGAAPAPRRARVAHDREQRGFGGRPVAAPRVQRRGVVGLRVAAAGGGGADGPRGTFVGGGGV